MMVARALASSSSSPAQPDERLLVEAAQKDPNRFSDLYELHFERVYAFIARRVGRRETAEDLTSGVFHKALANLSQFEWRGVPFVAWLLRIAANATTDHVKRGGRELNLEDSQELSARPRVEQAEDHARMFRLVNELPQDQRDVVVMRFAEEKSIREIAERLGRSEGAVKQLQFRALQSLRARFDSKNPQPRRTQRSPKESKKSGGKHG